MTYNPYPALQHINGAQPATENLARMQDRLMEQGDARGALVVLSHRFPHGLSLGEAASVQDMLGAAAGAPIDLGAIQRGYARGWRLWQPSGFKGAVARWLQAHPDWGRRPEDGPEAR